MRESSVQCVSAGGLHRMAYYEWGDPANDRVLVCVHGLTRCGRDFDFLAQAMSDKYRVVCPDVVGRGMSDWLKIKKLYGPPQYVADMVTLLARVNARTVHWIGTSMGGLIGMVLASLENTPISRLVLNDFGPVMTLQSMQRICEYVGKAPRFDSYAQAEAMVRFLAATFGKLTDAQWRHLTENVVRTAADGKIEFRYDPGIASGMHLALEQANGKDIESWPLYDAITCPTLLLRGAQSDLLLAATAAQMATRGPRARCVEFPEVGHAPALLDPAQITPIREFLLEAG